MRRYPQLVDELRGELVAKVGTPRVRGDYGVSTLNDRFSIVIVVVDSFSAGLGPDVTKGRVGTIGHDDFLGATDYHTLSSTAQMGANYTVPFVVPMVIMYPVPFRLFTYMGLPASHSR